MSKNTIISDVLDSIVLSSIVQEIEMLTALKDDLISRPKREKTEPKDTCASKAYPDSTVVQGETAETPDFYIGQNVSKKGGDYRFDGVVVSAFYKKSGAMRYVVEDDRGILHIYSKTNLISAAGA